mgnify:CR=1 FL=1
MSDKNVDFPNTVFITNLPDIFTLTELSELLESYGPIMEIERMQDGNIRIKFNNNEDAKKCFVQAKRSKLEFKKKIIGVIPKNLKKHAQQS